MKDVAANGVTVQTSNVVPLKRRTKPEPAQPQQVELPEGFKPLHPAEFAARMPGAQSGEFGETLARVDGREPIFCPECRAVHAPGNVARCRHVVEQRIVEGVASRLAQQAAPAAGEVALTPELFEQWKRDMRGECGEDWWTTRGYHFASLAKHFVSVAGLADESKRKTYPASCLARASRETYTKEKGTFAALGRWLETKGWGFVACELPKVSTKQRGTRDGRRKLAAVPMQPREVEALIAALPETTTKRRRATDPWRPVRDAVLFEWDTTLRPSTIERLRVPQHWQPGSHELFIAEDIDKEGFERTVKLAPRAVAVLERRAAALADGEGLLFGPYQGALRGHWYKAAKAAGIEDRRAKKISVYDFRHAAVKRYRDASGGDARGVGYMAGWRKPTAMLDRYAGPDREAGDRALARSLASEAASASTEALAAAIVVAQPAAVVLDTAEAGDYSSGPPREGGGIGRRTSLRC